MLPISKQTIEAKTIPSAIFKLKGIKNPKRKTFRVTAKTWILSIKFGDLSENAGLIVFTPRLKMTPVVPVNTIIAM